MRFYLSSFRAGDRVDVLRDWAAGRRLALIPNALDFIDLDERRANDLERLAELETLGLDAAVFDLADHFGDPDGLATALEGFGGVWVRGGNTFVLRQAMHLRDESC